MSALRIFSRAAYYLHRMQEAGVGASAQKIASALAPYAWAPSYLLSSGFTRIPAGSLARLEAFGAHVRASLQEQALSNPSFRIRVEARARRALSGRWPVLGFGEAPIPSGDGWASDPFHGYQWPARYFPLVDFVAAGRRCDVKIPWEFSRLQYLVWLAEGAVFVPPLRSQCLAAFTQIAENWIESNPPGRGVNWTCAMEVAIRGLNLMMATSIISPHVPETTRQAIIRSLADHYRFLRRFPEISDVPGNHYLADLLGEVGLSTVVGAPEAFEQHIQAFAAEAERQFEADGCHIERAPVYHRLCTDMVAIAAAFAAGRSSPACVQLQAILTRSIRFALAIADSYGQLPVIGDCDSGQIFEFGLPPRDIAALVALTELDQDRSAPDFTIWLRAIAGADRVVRVCVYSLPDVESRSGFLLAKSGPVSLVMRVGAQGLAGRASHDHDDAQSIWLSVNGRDLIVDGGCYAYTLDAATRSRNISSRSHNVLQPVARPRYGGREGSINLTMRGAPTCSVAEVQRVDETTRFTAMIEKAGPISGITRVAELAPQIGGFNLRVVDTWSSSEPVELRWHFGPGLEPEITADQAIRFAGEGLLCSCQIASESLLNLEVLTFDFSPAYGQKLPCFGVRAVLAATPAGTSPISKIVSRFQIRPALLASHGQEINW